MTIYHTRLKFGSLMTNCLTMFRNLSTSSPSTTDCKRSKTKICFWSPSMMKVTMTMNRNKMGHQCLKCWTIDTKMKMTIKRTIMMCSVTLKHKCSSMNKLKKKLSVSTRNQRKSLYSIMIVGSKEYCHNQYLSHFLITLCIIKERTWDWDTRRQWPNISRITDKSKTWF